MDYLDFAIEVHAQRDGDYVIAVRSPAGEARTTASFPFTDAALESHLLKLENAILRSAGRRRKTPTAEEEAVQHFGRELFGFLLCDELLSRFRACQQLAHDQQKGVRIKLTVAPELAGLPWEFLYDAARRDYLCLDATAPLVRYPALPLTIQPLPVTPPLRILGLCVDATDQPRLDVAEEKARLDAAVQPLQAQGLVEVTWLTGQTADDLQRALRRGPWHILHFIGHGRFDAMRDEGLLLLTDSAGRAAPLYATQLARLLASQRHHLRLVLLNACEGARGGRLDLFASTAARLVGSGIPAVLAMQYEITDAAAIDFARTFYEALADNLPVDSAVADARNAMTLRTPYSLEWGTPVLYLRAPDGRLFDVNQMPIPARPLEQPEVGEKRNHAAHNIQVKQQGTHQYSTIDFGWVFIPPGEFLMGSYNSWLRDEGWNSTQGITDKYAMNEEMPQHRLFLFRYRITRVPVTNAQYKIFVDATGHRIPAHWKKGQIPDKKEDHPVVNVSWHDAVAFCRWAGVNLPSEAQWEKAARGIDGRIWPWGNDPPDVEHCNNNVWDTTPVGKYIKGASPYDVLDMAGNVWEWTSSRWGDTWENPDFGYPYKQNDGREDFSAGGLRVVRGGSFDDSANFVRCAVRDRYDPNFCYDDIGFRVVITHVARQTNRE